MILLELITLKNWSHGIEKNVCLGQSHAQWNKLKSPTVYWGLSHLYIRVIGLE